MKQCLNVYQVDAFTEVKFMGNPAGVVTNANDLSEAQMLKLARELNNSETAFILDPIDETHDYRVRFFTPTVEVPSCGHASLAAGYIWSVEGGFKKKRMNQLIQIGVLPIDIVKENNSSLVYMTQGEVEIGEELVGPTRSKVISSLNINEDDLIDSLPIQIISTGHSKVMVPLKSLKTLNSISPNLSALSELSEEIKHNCFFLFAIDESEPGVLTHARMFAPKIGINEDPVTGNGNGPLGAYLIYHKILEADERGEVSFKSKQGEVMGRAGYATVKVNVDNGRPAKVRVGGSCEIAFKTKIEIE
ncbi:MAG: PhzF family phenazine biosynthesis isomerase [Cyclobacteriaceae bacterium]